MNSFGFETDNIIQYEDLSILWRKNYICRMTIVTLCIMCGCKPQLTCRNNTFSLNVAQDDGGAIYITPLPADQEQLDILGRNDFSNNDPNDINDEDAFNYDYNTPDQEVWSNSTCM